MKSLYEVLVKQNIKTNNKFLKGDICLVIATNNWVNRTDLVVVEITNIKSNTISSSLIETTLDTNGNDVKGTKTDMEFKINGYYGYYKDSRNTYFIIPEDTSYMILRYMFMNDSKNFGKEYADIYKECIDDKQLNYMSTDNFELLSKQLVK